MKVRLNAAGMICDATVTIGCPGLDYGARSSNVNASQPGPTTPLHMPIRHPGLPILARPETLLSLVVAQIINFTSWWRGATVGQL